MVGHYQSLMTKLGVANELWQLGPQDPADTSPAALQLPPVILGRYGSDTGKPTLCAYGHLDVQPAPMSKGDGWKTDPFVLTRVAASAADDAAKGYGDFPSGGHEL